MPRVSAGMAGYRARLLPVLQASHPGGTAVTSCIRPVSHPFHVPSGGMRLVVIGDSLSFHGPVGPLPLSDLRLYPNVVARTLAEHTGATCNPVVYGRAGWGVREAWLALQKDVHLQQAVLVGADAVVFGIGSIDSVPVGVPRGVLAGLPFVRPTPLRRRLRRRIDASHPTLVRLTRQRWRYTPVSVYRHCWRKCIEAVRLFTSGAPVVAVLPSIHRGAYYAGGERHHPSVYRMTRALAAELQVPLVDLPALAEPHLDNLNPDGLHWPFELHAEVGTALAMALLKELDQ